MDHSTLIGMAICLCNVGTTKWQGRLETCIQVLLWFSVVYQWPLQCLLLQTNKQEHPRKQNKRHWDKLSLNPTDVSRSSYGVQSEKKFWGSNNLLKHRTCEWETWGYTKEGSPAVPHLYSLTSKPHLYNHHFSTLNTHCFPLRRATQCGAHGSLTGSPGDWPCFNSFCEVSSALLYIVMTNVSLEYISKHRQ